MTRPSRRLLWYLGRSGQGEKVYVLSQEDIASACRFEGSRVCPQCSCNVGIDGVVQWCVAICGMQALSADRRDDTCVGDATVPVVQVDGAGAIAGKEDRLCTAVVKLEEGQSARVYGERVCRP